VTTRFAAIAAVLLLAIVVVRRPAPRPPFETSASPFPNPSRSGARALGSRSRRGGAVAGMVYVAGAVRHPGLYRVAGGERVADEIARAGGLKTSADAAAVNLAAHPSDGDEIYVPAEGDPVSRAALGSRSLRGAGSVRRRQTRSRAAAAQIPAQSIDVNRDDAATLALVPGIGPAIAARIVALREREGAFASLDELLDVAGMTQSKLDRARTYLHSP
jgi:competence protein ComEA